jgi:hypothetical protein
MATVPHPVPTVEPHSWGWTKAVNQASAIAHAKLPASLHGDLERATSLVLSGAVFYEDNGATCQVRSGKDATVFYAVNGHCDCERAKQAHKGYCKHRLGAALYLKADELFRAGPPAPDQVLGPDAPADDHSPDEADLHASRAIPQQYIQLIRGKPFVKYFGLLEMATQQGLVKLSEDFIGVPTEKLALTMATAEFADGRIFRACADATPGNVHKDVAVHWLRIALTRAKARALRDALSIGVCSVEELD